MPLDLPRAKTHGPSGYLVKAVRLLPDGSHDLIQVVEFNRIQSAKRNAANYSRESGIYATIYDLQSYGQAIYQYLNGKIVATKAT